MAEVILLERPERKWVKGDDSALHYLRLLAGQLSLISGAVVHHELSYCKWLAGRIGDAERFVTNGMVASRSANRTIGSMQTRSPQSGTRLDSFVRARMLPRRPRG